MILELKKTSDILAEASKKRPEGMIVVGFAAETNDVVSYARSKLEKKGLDLVVANDITKAGAGFDTDTNIATLLIKRRQPDRSAADVKTRDGRQDPRRSSKAQKELI